MLETAEKFKNIYHIHSWLDSCAYIFDEIMEYGPLKVDLGQLKWLTPAGFTVLLSTLNYLDRFYFLETIPPRYDSRSDKFDIVGYMERMNFLTSCPEDVKLSFEKMINMDYYYNRNRKRKEKELDELRISRCDRDIEDLERSIKRIMKGKGLHINRISDIAEIVTELAQNAVEHADEVSDAECYSCVQYYKETSTQPGRVEIAISDTGRGIVDSLRDHVDFGSSNDKIVEKAIFTRASRLPEQDRGKGFNNVRRTAFGWSSDAEFYVRTHDSIYRIYEDRLELLDKGKYFPGTFYYIIINV
ncbi:hypothetical protein BK121_26740 [Paenibacillus odorifer]|uniref:ATP-binding protein n=1 Tax=Paenibacillus TaxID=44249 RepID=UPI00096D18C2|nr:ATP-binding protein [Paenibacillus odorifer]OMC63530.1 hypothetical protein BK121_26740 [Paenibacillus odorifer]